MHCLMTPFKSAVGQRLISRARRARCCETMNNNQGLHLSRRGNNSKMSNSPEHQAKTSPEGSECTQLLQLLARNPSAALQIFKFASPSDEKPYPVQIYRGRRAKCTPRINNKLNFQSQPKTQCSSNVRVYCFPPKFDDSRTILETSQKPANSRHVHLLSDEDIELKSKCVDDFGNFDFDALLPAIYWKCRENMNTNNRHKEKS